MKIVPSNLSSGGNPSSDWVSELELELELELDGSQFSIEGRIFSQMIDSSNWLGRRGKIFLSFSLMVPIYSTELPREWSPRQGASRKW